MGNSIFKRVFGNKEIRVYITGLDAAGKTTALYTLKLSEIVPTEPTIFNIEQLQFKNLTMTAFDYGGRDKSRPLHTLYYLHVQGLVYVLDSNDKERLDEALEELFSAIKDDERWKIPVLVLANKQDLPNAVKPIDIAAKLHDEPCMRHIRWNVFGVCATDQKNNGLFDAFDWLANELARTEKDKLASYLIYGTDSGNSIKRNNSDKHVIVKSGKNTKHFYSNFVDSLKKMII